jgi:hypothetical protein
MTARLHRLDYVYKKATLEPGKHPAPEVQPACVEKYACYWPPKLSHLRTTILIHPREGKRGHESRRVLCKQPPKDTKH